MKKTFLTVLVCVLFLTKTSYSKDYSMNIVDVDLDTEKLAIVGDGSYSGNYVAELKALAKNNPNILFLGNQTGHILNELYSNTFLFVLPSESEGLSLALLEAMSYRRPVLVSNIPENKEGVGEIGFTFKCNDVKDLTDKLKYILKHDFEVKKNGELGRKRVEEHYNWEQIAKDVVKLYSQPQLKFNGRKIIPKFSWLK